MRRSTGTCVLLGRRPHRGGVLPQQWRQDRSRGAEPDHGGLVGHGGADRLHQDAAAGHRGGRSRPRPSPSRSWPTSGSPLAPGLFQGNFDAMNAFATYVNANGGIGCRKLVVKQWDTKLDPTESKNGLIDACANAVALVGQQRPLQPRRLGDDQLRRQVGPGDRAARHRRAGQRHQRAVRPDRLRHPGRRRAVPDHARPAPAADGHDRPDQVVRAAEPGRPARDLHGARRPADHGAVVRHPDQGADRRPGSRWTPRRRSPAPTSSPPTPRGSRRSRPPTATTSTTAPTTWP